MQRRLAIPLLIAIAALLCAGLAAAEISQNGNLRLHFSGRIAPKKLPRTNTAPVTVRISGAIGTADGQRPPELNKIAIAFNRYGQRLDRGTADLRSRANSSRRPPRVAREACGGAAGRPRQVQSERGATGTRDLSGDRRHAGLQLEQERQAGACCSIYTRRTRSSSSSSSPSGSSASKKGTFGTIFVARIPKLAGSSAT